MRNQWASGSAKTRERYEKDLIELRKQIKTTNCDVQLAQLRAIRANQNKLSIEHPSSFVNACFAVNQQHASFYAQELERSQMELDLLRSQVANKERDIQRSKDELQQQLSYLQSLNKEFDKKLMDRAVLETELQTLREELEFMRAVYKEQYSESHSLGSVQIIVDKFYRDQLARAIVNIRKDFESLAFLQREECE
ncbi:unnamed protein product, partial [Rotaria sp. Silwood2]